MYKVISIIAIVVVGVAGLFFWKKKQTPVIQNEFVDILKLKDLIVLFKKDSVRSKLKSNKNLIACCLKENHEQGIKVTPCLFDQEKNQVCDFQDATVFIAKKLDEDLLGAFGDKDMLILK